MNHNPLFRTIKRKGIVYLMSNYIFPENRLIIGENTCTLGGSSQLDNQNRHDAKLTSTEISQLWTAYQNDSMTICILEYFLETVENQEIASLVKKGLDWLNEHQRNLKGFFIAEKWPIPYGFTEKDKNLEAPKLFSDTFMLFFIYQTSILGLGIYSLAVSLAARKDIHSYFSKCLRESIQMNEETKELLLEKGLYVRSPYLFPPNSPEFIKDDNFLGGWFGGHRALLSTEIAHLYVNIQQNSLSQTLLTAYAQTASDDKVKNYMLAGKNIIVDHISVFSKLLKESDLPASVTWDNQVTASKTAPFSDKLMMAQTNSFIAASIGLYGISKAASLRKDLVSDYTRLSDEKLQYLHKGTQIMIQNKWMEEPPQAINHDQLAKTRQ